MTVTLRTFKIVISYILLVIGTFVIPTSAQTRGILVSPTTGVGIGTVWGVFIGISQYQQTSLNLSFADKDAQSLHELFADNFRGRIPPDHFRLLVNDQATRGGTLQALSEVLRLAQPEDLVVITMALHGLPEIGGSDLYFLMHDTDASRPEDRGISQYDIFKQIQRSKVRKIVMFLDACHAGAFASGDSKVARRSTDAAEINRLLTAMGQSQDGITIMSSSSAAEQSQEGKQFCGGHGAFTCALLNGLKGGADFDRNGMVQIRELFDYTYREVKTSTRGIQHPAIEGRYDNGLPLVTTPIPPVVDATPKAVQPKKEIDLSEYERIQELADYQSKMEQAWKAVQSLAQLRTSERSSRLALMDKFTKDFPVDNPHLKELEGLRKRFEQEARTPPVEKSPTAGPLPSKERPTPTGATSKASSAEELKGIEVASLPTYKIPQLIPRQKEFTGKDGVPMVLIPGGEFIMGSEEKPEERPPHPVYLADYFIDIFEVTTSLYRRFLVMTKHESPYKWEDVLEGRDDNKPVIGVTHHDAVAYCRWAEKRLPTEAEWEKAARSTDQRRFPWGNEEPSEVRGNFGHCCGWKGYSLLSAVGTTEQGKSLYGVHDLAGNVWEWVSDWYAPDYYKKSPSSNPTGPSTGDRKVIRGGSWSNAVADLRVTARDRVPPAYKNMSLGFRCARDFQPD